MYEAEVKFRVDDPVAIARALAARMTGSPRVRVSQNEYYDFIDGRLAAAEQEVRIRGVREGSAQTWYFTAKDAPFDVVTKSKPEYEIEIDNPDHMRCALQLLGLLPTIRFEKNFSLFAFNHEGSRVEAVLASIPDLRDSFLEMEILASTEEAANVAIANLRNLAGELGLRASDETSIYYTALVANARKHRANV